MMPHVYSHHMIQFKLITKTNRTDIKDVWKDS